MTVTLSGTLVIGWKGPLLDWVRSWTDPVNPFGHDTGVGIPIDKNCYHLSIRMLIDTLLIGSFGCLL